MRWTTAKIRQSFLDFFKEHGHTIISSFPIVPKGDPTLLFVNAGMAPMKDYFLGIRTPPSRRVVDSQKCLRISGKHNDLEAVGRDAEGGGNGTGEGDGLASDSGGQSNGSGYNRNASAFSGPEGFGFYNLGETDYNGDTAVGAPGGLFPAGFAAPGATPTPGGGDLSGPETFYFVGRVGGAMAAVTAVFMALTGTASWPVAGATGAVLTLSGLVGWAATSTPGLPSPGAASGPGASPTP